MEQTKRMIAEVFSEISDVIKSGSFKRKVRIGLTTFGSEHGMEEMVRAAQIAASKYDDFTIVLIGPKADCGFEAVKAKDAEDGHRKMIELLEKKELDGCVTQHFDFPIGVSTVGRVITPGRGKEMIIATTTGTSATNRIEAMIKNAVAGIAAAKALGIKEPSVGILNVDGARGTLRALEELGEKGYNIRFASSLRTDGGAIMRGNDLLAGTPDIMVCDSLTGNLLVKILSSFTTGGDYETVGFGYGPGVGEGYKKIINIISRASGAPLIAEALRYCASCTQNDLAAKAEQEFKNANDFGLKNIIENINMKAAVGSPEEVKIPPKKVVTYGIVGIDILELENACKTLWRSGIYSESGMGCTGPVILVNEDDSSRAIDILKNEGYK